MYKYLFYLLFLIPVDLIASAPVWNNGGINQCAVAGTTGCTVTITIAAGHNVYVAAAQDSATTLVPTFSDSGGNTYTTPTGGTITIGTAKLQIGVVVNLPAQITTVKVTWNTASAITMPIQVADITGAITTNNGIDDNANAIVTATGLATSTSLTSGNATTNQTTDLLINWTWENVSSSGWAVCGAGGNGFATPTGGTAASLRMGASDKTVSSSGSQGTTCESWTTTGADRLSILASLTSIAPTTLTQPLPLIGVGPGN